MSRDDFEALAGALLLATVVAVFYYLGSSVALLGLSRGL
jgi:hypothetical protein